MRKVTLALAMLPLLASAPAFAAAPVGEAGPVAKPVQTAFADGLLSGWGNKRASATRNENMQLAQAGDPRVGELQEQLRQLSGKVEELNFQILQLQDQLRKTQEDNEFRFQELEKNKRSDAGSSSRHADASAASPATNEASQDASSGRDHAPAQNAGSADSMAIGSEASQDAPVRGQPPQTLGSIRFDTNGNVIGETLDAAPQSSGQGAGPSAEGSDTLASLPNDDNPNSLYQAAYQYLMSGDYKAAETGFREHVKRYPADPTTAEARYWLGESLFGQGRFPEAATVFIDTQRDYPDSRRAPENMFKLGLTLERMDNRDVACATFKQIPERYPEAAPAILKRVADERSRIKC
nr:tol-pal system protein YbgF [Falsochrobactrum shanghaiense]